MKKNEPIRILHVFGKINRGGAESRTMEIYRNIDREKVQFDFLVSTDETGHYEAEILALGGRVFSVPRFLFYNYFSYRKAVKKLFAEHKDISVVHGHMTSTASLYLPIAKKAGVPTTIAHSRNAGVESGIKGILTNILEYRLDKIADYLFACSRIAGIAVFGKRVWESGRVKYIPNTIDTDKFKYDILKREEIQNKFALTDKFVIGHVGRFVPQKNHGYLIKIFDEIQKQIPESCLLLVGDGEGQNKIQATVMKLGIADKIIFAGQVDNPWEYYQAMDYFVFPSLYEGLPGSVVEAQTSGLKCIISDVIADEVKLTNLVSTKSLKENPTSWADFVIKTRNYSRVNMSDAIKDAGFDVKAKAKEMEKFYLNLKKK